MKWRLLDVFSGVAFSVFVGLGGMCWGQASNGNIATSAGVSGGLVVQLGAKAADDVIALGASGRYLVHILATSPSDVVSVRHRCRDLGYSGLVSADVLTSGGRLPYADNLVNLLVVEETLAPASEIFRVVTPEGAVVVRPSAGVTPSVLVAAGFSPDSGESGLQIFRKLWPKEMDVWSHPRHDATGNAVSDDTLVGPASSIRWIAGATNEVEGVVAAGGRNFYGGLLARDSFNGLRLWSRDLRRAETNEVDFHLPRIIGNRARPIADDNMVFAVEKDALVALDAATGTVRHTFEGMRSPTEAACCGGLIVACNENSVQAFHAETGEKVWAQTVSVPRNLVADEQHVSLIHGREARGETVSCMVLSTASGEVLWQRSDLAWLPRVRRTVLHGDLLVFEVSSFNNDDTDNVMHVLAVKDGALLWEKAFPPGMNHNRQARAMFIGDDLWILHGGRTGSATPEQKPKYLPITAAALDPKTGEQKTVYKAGLTHCFPPVASRNYIFSGVMTLTDLRTGETSENPITKAHCSRENGWVIANGLIYNTPKHCTCWPILRGFTALSSDREKLSSLEDLPLLQQIAPDALPTDAAAPEVSDWPCYRYDSWRSSCTPAPGPQKLDVIWTADLGDCNRGKNAPIIRDWCEDEFVKGPITPPTIAYGSVYMARPDSHEVVALDAGSGAVRWRFTANGRVDTPPTLYRGLCLFGCRSGWVYALRSDSGKLVWRLRAAPGETLITTYGQLESLWPVAGSVLVSDGVAYVAAGRQPLTNGGVTVYAVDPLTGEKKWMHRLDTIPQKGFYENSGLEFDPYDLLHREGDGITMSRWKISADGQTVSVDKWEAFAKLNPGGRGEVWMPRGCWSYAPRHQHRFGGEASRRPLCAYGAGTLVGALNGTTTLFRRDFDTEQLGTFQKKWITGWRACEIWRQDGRPYRSDRLAENASWSLDLFPLTADGKPVKPKRRGAQLYNDIHGLVVAGGTTIYIAHKDGRLLAVSLADGKVLQETRVPEPAWDGLAVAGGRLYLSTQTGDVVCLGE